MIGIYFIIILMVGFGIYYLSKPIFYYRTFGYINFFTYILNT